MIGTSQHTLVGKPLVLVEDEWNIAFVIKADLDYCFFLAKVLHVSTYRPLGEYRVLALSQISDMGDDAIIFDTLDMLKEWRGDNARSNVVKLVNTNKPKKVPE